MLARAREPNLRLTFIKVKAGGQVPCLSNFPRARHRMANNLLQLHSVVLGYLKSYRASALPPAWRIAVHVFISASIALGQDKDLK